MKNVAFAVVALGMVACGNNNNSHPDTGSITLPDTGPATGHDSGPATGHDSGPAMTGACTVSISASGVGSLMGGCFPRCSAATLTAINACPANDTGTCLDAALNADTTAGVAWMENGRAATAPLDCGTCFTIQQFHCLSASGCNNEVVALLMCQQTFPDGGTADCTTQETALTNCTNVPANMTAIGNCFQDGTMGVQACFGG